MLDPLSFILAAFIRARPPKKKSGKANYCKIPKRTFPEGSLGIAAISTPLSVRIFNRFGSLNKFTLPLRPSIFRKSADLPSAAILTLSIKCS